MKTCLTFALLGAAGAFAPSQQASRTASVAVQSSLIDDAFGISVETGNKCPPLGRWILEDANENGVKWFQNAELKHGRVAMVATSKFGGLFQLVTRNMNTHYNCTMRTNDKSRLHGAEVWGSFPSLFGTFWLECFPPRIVS